MLRSKRLMPVMKLAERKEQQALTAVAQLQQQIMDEEKKVEELSQYRMEYQKGLNASGSISVGQLQSYQEFMAQLDSIIANQKTHQVQMESELERLRAIYQQLHIRTKSLDTLVGKHRQKEHQQHEKQLQKELDELCMRNHTRPAH